MADILSAYYEAMNKHNMEDILTYIHSDIAVTFPESERNWQGVENVRIKFGGMFEKMPTFRGDYVISNIEENDNAIYLHTKCTFKCQQTNFNSSRPMIYTINNTNKITKIQHL